MKARKVFILMSLTIVGTFGFSTAQAQANFECKVESAVEVGPEGSFVEDDLYDSVVGDVFSVDRETGMIDGLLRNHNESGEPEVLDHGSDVQTFKAVTVYKPHVTISYIEIQTWGHQPFIYKKGMVVLTGRCMSYPGPH